MHIGFLHAVLGGSVDTNGEYNLMHLHCYNAFAYHIVNLKLHLAMF